MPPPPHAAPHALKIIIQTRANFHLLLALLRVEHLNRREQFADDIRNVLSFDLGLWAEDQPVPEHTIRHSLDIVVGEVVTPFQDGAGAGTFEHIQGRSRAGPQGHIRMT